MTHNMYAPKLILDHSFTAVISAVYLSKVLSIMSSGVGLGSSLIF